MPSAKTFLETFTQHVLEPTRVSNTLNLILTTFQCKVNRIEVIPGISDHHIPYAELLSMINRRRQATHPVGFCKRADWNGLRDHLKSLNIGLPNHQPRNDR